MAQLFSAGGDLDTALAEQVAATVRQAVEAAIRGLPPAARTQVAARHDGHLLCTLLAAAAEGLAPLADADTALAGILARAVFPDPGGLAPQLGRKLLRATVIQVVGLAAPTPLTKVRDTVRLLRVGAVALCPAPDRHRAVRTQCLAPLVGEGANTMMLEHLTDLASARLEPG